MPTWKRFLPSPALSRGEKVDDLMEYLALVETNQTTQYASNVYSSALAELAKEYGLAGSRYLYDKIREEAKKKFSLPQLRDVVKIFRTGRDIKAIGEIYSQITGEQPISIYHLAKELPPGLYTPTMIAEYHGQRGDFMREKEALLISIKQQLDRYLIDDPLPLNLRLSGEKATGITTVYWGGEYPIRLPNNVIISSLGPGNTIIHI